VCGEIGVEVGAVNVGGGGGMTDIRWPPHDGEQQQSQVLSSGRVAGGGGEGNRQISDVVDATTHYSDDERSVAADSWSVKSEYGSTLDGEDQRTVDVVDALNAAAFRPLDYLYVVFLLIPSLLCSNIIRCFHSSTLKLGAQFAEEIKPMQCYSHLVLSHELLLPPSSILKLIDRLASRSLPRSRWSCIIFINLFAVYSVTECMQAFKSRKNGRCERLAYVRTTLRPSPVILKGKIRVSLFLLMWCKNSCQALYIGQISFQCHCLKLELRERISFLGKITCGLSASDTTLINFSRWIQHYCSSSSESGPENRASGLM